MMAARDRHYTAWAINQCTSKGFSTGQTSLQRFYSFWQTVKKKKQKKNHILLAAYYNNNIMKAAYRTSCYRYLFYCILVIAKWHFRLIVPSSYGMSCTVLQNIDPIFSSIKSSLRQTVIGTSTIKVAYTP